MKTIGIDLGTTNSLVAYWTDNGPEIIPNVIGARLTPSVVSVDETGEILVGQIARERLITHPHLTAASFKRFMGTEKRFSMGNYNFTPEELSSFVLQSLKADAEAFLGTPVEEAIISVPAYFNDAQRKATKYAAELAGLKVERLINEPTAAALSYGIHRQEESTFLVFDLGGGTFDISILEIFEGVIEVKSVAGDNFLGGEDFTNALVSYFKESQELDREALNLKTMSALYKQAEFCKCALGRSEKEKMSIMIDGKSYEMTVDNDSFESIVSQLLFRLRHPIERALRDASLNPRDLNAVILVGGATRMPVVKSTVGKILKQLPFTNINPDEAIALGAAVQAALKDKNEALDELIMTDVCPYSLGTSVSKSLDGGKYESGYYLPIIERNTAIPISKVEQLCTLKDNQTLIVIDVYQGESRRAQDNIKLGELWIKIPPAPAGEETIEVRYTYDINGILEVEAVVVSTGKKGRLIIEKSPGSLSREEIDERFRVLESIKIHPREHTENRLLLAKGERLYQEALGENREHIDYILRRFEQVLESQNERAIKKAAKELKGKLEEIERWWGY